MEQIDFRSDTVTWPTEAMWQAMSAAKVGDDVYGEDPTVNELEAKAAEMLGKEASLFVSSGTMGNLTAILSQAGRGDEAIAGFDTHAITDEGGGLSVLGGVLPRVLPTDDLGRMNLGAIENAVNPDDPHYARSRLILLENSYGAKSGAPVPVEYIQYVCEIADRHGLAVHLDGARLFNTAAALKITAKEIVKNVDTISFCLSKGLCAPIGSMLCGSLETIHKAHRIRKVLGGGMRQAGIIAAAGVVALDEMVDRLVVDNERAQIVAQGIGEIPGLKINIEAVRTNIIFFEVDLDRQGAAAAVASALRGRYNILIGAGSGNTIRLVTHYYTGIDEINQLLSALAATVDELG